MNAKILVFSVFTLLLSCNSENIESNHINPETADSNIKNSEVGGDLEFKEDINLSDENYDMSYFSGQAEIATYTLKKARYQDIHPGEAVLVFVSEPFLSEKQVKADRPNSDNSVKVLKMNRIDRFSTGVYDYSQFTSVFTPYQKYDAKYPIKITMGSQDWCGQSFYQVNNRNGFEFNQKSYFESEGDTIFNLDYVLTEDNMLNLIRISKDLLPIGEFEILPSISYLRSSHIEVKSYLANGSISSGENGFIYEYTIPEIKRSVKIHVSNDNQNRIMKWEETYPTVFDGTLRKSIYEMKGVEVMPYWRMNNKEDSYLRKELKLLN
ncbi:septum formation inhibitor Maf [Brumimicrobium mesophilum]|uniref:septum formation inhibitor Maf n=1 Tax=Brumimicrobium mesophilum TaxID=392717 RepID=UPI00131CA66C|nr:septum formation inhibitor Maf [Brumimicrobium mesophilum]